MSVVTNSEMSASALITVSMPLALTFNCSIIAPKSMPSILDMISATSLLSSVSVSARVAVSPLSAEISVFTLSTVSPIFPYTYRFTSFPRSLVMAM